MKKKVKAWAIVTNRGKIIGSNMEFPPGLKDSTIGATKYPAIYFLKVFAKRRLSWIVKPHGYKIVPIEITYQP